MRSEKRPSLHKYTFHIDTVTPEQTKNHTYLGINMNATGNFNKAVNDLRDQARRAFYGIKVNIKLDIPIKIWLKKIFEAVIEPTALYGCELWGPCSTAVSSGPTALRL